MTWRGYTLLIAVLAAMAVGSWFAWQALTPAPPFRSDVLDVVRSPERVRVQRLVPQSNGPVPEGAAYYEPAKLVGGGKAIEPDAEWIRKFSGLVTSGRTFESPAKSCDPLPMVVVRFVRGEHRVDVLVAFDCNVLLVQSNGVGVGTGDFDAYRPEFLALAKQLFPNDPAIQALYLG